MDTQIQERMLELTDHIEWMAQTVHQAYRVSNTGSWRGCNKRVRVETRIILDREQ